MGQLPSGTVTFMFTDVEGSTKLLERDAARMTRSLARHHEILGAAVETHAGHVFETLGDEVCAAFARPTDALAAALDGQRGLLAEPWDKPGPIRVRIGLHTGEVELQPNGHYIGRALFRVARLMGIAHGGQVLLSSVTAAHVRDAMPGGTMLKDLGHHRLRDLAEPEHVFQLVHPDLPADFRAPRSLDSFPNNLPAQLTSFVGRDKELTDVKRLLSSTRLLTLTGAGGSGKTRLALHAAADVLDQFPDGAWVVDMAPLAEPQLLPHTVATAVGLHEQPGQSILSSVLEWLSGKKLLLLLDNCEHLVDATARFVETVPRSCPAVHILVTSRAALGIGGEATWRIPSLSLADPDHLPPIESLTQYEAVRLFIERAVAAQPNFAVTNQNAPAVAQICHRLDGIPLAIELAAARVRVLSPDQIAARLNDRFHLLTGGSRTALPRQQTLRALVDWSHDLLDEKERALLRRLSLFPGGWTLEAAEAVCAGEPIENYEVLDLLTALIDKSLIQTGNEQDEGAVRFHMLETIRQYAEEKLAATSEAEAFREAQINYYLNLLEGHSGRDGSDWLESVYREHDNIRSILGRLHRAARAGGGGGANQGLDFIRQMGRVWFLRDQWEEGRNHINQHVSVSGADQHPAYAHALVHDARLAVAQGRYAEAQASADKALAAADPNDAEAVAGARWVQSMCATYRGQHQEAQRIAEETLRQLPAGAPDAERIEAQVRLGNAMVYNNRAADAIQQIEAALTLARKTGEDYWIAHCLAALGRAREANNDLDGAIQALEEAVTRHSAATGSRAGPSMYRLGDLELARGNPDRAAEWYCKAWNLGEKARSPLIRANALRGLAAVRAQSQRDDAGKLLAAAEHWRSAANASWRPSEESQFTRTRDALGAAFTQALQQCAGKTPEQAFSGLPVNCPA